MLSTPFICCSSGVATACSNVCASAPTYVATIWISGGAMFGNCAIGKLRTVSEPTSTRTIEITIATIGRLMKNFDMTLPADGFRGEWFRIDADPGADFLDTLGDNPLTWMESTGNHPAPIHLRPDCHRPDVDLIVGVHDGNLVAALQLRNRPLWHKECVVLDVDEYPHFRIPAGAQDVVRIRE